MTKTIGRPRLYAPKPVETKFTVEDLEWLDSQAKIQGLSRSDLIRQAVSRLKDSK